MNEAPLLEGLGSAQVADRPVRARAFLDAARKEAATRAEAGVSGVEIARGLSGAADALVAALFELVRPEGSKVAIVATGGYGRGELCPYSDLDLLFVYPGGADAEVSALAEAILYPLWDCGLEVGHAVRDIEHSVALAREDLSVCTALLDARRVAGDAELARGLSETTWRALHGAGTNDFVRRLIEEMQGRHARFGQTLYLLEPNIKSGAGGYRDLCVGLWAAKARFRAQTFEELVTLGELPARRAGALGAARDFYLRVRTLAHLFAKRRQDQLTFQVQEAIAPRLYPDARVREGELRPAVAPAVEELMRAHQLSAKTVLRETFRLLERCVIPPQRAPVIRRVDGSFVTFEGQLQAHSADVFRDRPSEMVRIFRVALDLGVPLHPHARDVISEEAHRTTGDREAAAHFLALLCDPRDERTPSLVEQMHDLGLLAALMPEFAPCSGRVQHDLYHVFTVDQHSLYAVGHLKTLGRGQLAKEHPVPTGVLSAITRPHALYLGTLLHDVGKPLGKGHSEKGARLANAIAARFGMEKEDAERAEFLVRKHLVMSHLSQRRDIHDMELVARFAAEMGDEEALRELYLLTWADMSMVAPGNLTEWKDMLLRELYQRTLAFMQRGPDLAARDSSAMVRRRKQEAQKAFASEGEAGTFLSSLPDRYFVVTPPVEIKLHVRLSEARAVKSEPLALDIHHHPRKGYSVVTVLCDDSPGLLSRLCGVLVAHRLDILAAQIASRVREGQVGEVIDVFYVRDRDGSGLTARKAGGKDRFAGVAGDFADVVSGRKSVETLVLERGRARGALPPRVTPKVMTEVEVDNEVSADYTVIDVYTQDRLGVLYAITRALAAAGLDVYFSKVGAEADRVTDVFYVRDKESGAKVTDPARLQDITRALESALGALP
jgi:[protein-PII] uridylyltransferase